VGAAWRAGPRARTAAVGALSREPDRRACSLSARTPPSGRHEFAHVNLHLMLAASYRPTAGDPHPHGSGAFSPTACGRLPDRLAGLDPRPLLELSPAAGEGHGAEEAIEACLAGNGEEIALVLWRSAVCTGQAVRPRAHRPRRAPARLHCGLRPGASIGIRPWRLHDAEADFAVWCSYKYLNAARVRSAAASSTSVTGAQPPCAQRRLPGARLRRLWGQSRRRALSYGAAVSRPAAWPLADQATPILVGTAACLAGDLQPRRHGAAAREAIELTTSRAADPPARGQVHIITPATAAARLSAVAAISGAETRACSRLSRTGMVCDGARLTSSGWRGCRIQPL